MRAVLFVNSEQVDIVNSQNFDAFHKFLKLLNVAFHYIALYAAREAHAVSHENIFLAVFFGKSISHGV